MFHINLLTMTEELPLKAHRAEERRAWGYFAAATMQSLVLDNADAPINERATADTLARRAGEYADALLAQRRRRFKWVPRDAESASTTDQP
jgi:hypothetical protein